VTATGIPPFDPSSVIADTYPINVHYTERTGSITYRERATVTITEPGAQRHHEHG
jgi:hypothetical protein